MNVGTGGRVAGALLGSALAVLGAAPATAAASTTTEGPATISAGRLILEPTARGYQGSVPVTVTNRSGAAEYYSVRITEPVAGSFQGLRPTGACAFAGRVDDRRIVECGLPGPDLAPGERRSFAVAFEVLTAPRPYAMTAADGRVEVVPGHTGQVADGENFPTLFRSTDGSLRHPRPYVRDTEARAAIGASVGAVALARQADGTYAGRLPVTVRYAGDAPHDYLAVLATLPAGVEVTGTDPQDAPSFGGWFEVPGGQLSAGAERAFDVLFRALAGTVAGDLGTVELTLSTLSGADEVRDADPTDNVLRVTLDAVDNG
ncbi:hypothetical protein ACFT9M_14920 [Micromonospora purpureochromogenes]|uniref:hypothetical protein n=1 Tax=Micromonospora purpureochromogenes TaxID=47872 RepID=UPI00362622E4